MTGVTYYLKGFSDDCIEVECPMQGLFDEYYGYEGYLVAQPSGDRFHIHYGGLEARPDDWVITHVHSSSQLTVVHTPVSEGESGGYTDVMKITGDITCMQFFKNWPPAREEYIEHIAEALGCDADDLDMRKHRDDVVMKVWEALGSP